MGFFNVLVTNCQCNNCGNVYDARIQFKFGATRQLEYKIGNRLCWGYNEVGEPGLAAVKVYGILENDECSICHSKGQNEEFDIYLEDDVIVRIDKMESAEDFFQNEGCYKIID